MKSPEFYRLSNQAADYYLQWNANNDFRHYNWGAGSFPLRGRTGRKEKLIDRRNRN